MYIVVIAFMILAGCVWCGCEDASVAGPASVPATAASYPSEVRFEVGEPSAEAFGGAFQGFGVELDPFYWNENNLARGADAAGWRLMEERLTAMRLPIVRVMMQLKWCQEDADGTRRQWDSQQMKAVFAVLDFCQANDVHVILTDWGWAANRNSNLKFYDDPSDPRYTASMAAYLEEFIVRRKYSCIKYFVIGNEPDHELIRQHSLAQYVTMYRNMDQALRQAGLRQKVMLTGPDVAGKMDLFRDAVAELAPILDVYDFHGYTSPASVSNIGVPGPDRTAWYRMDSRRAEVLQRDPNGARKPLIIGEMGMGAPGASTNRHTQIDTFAYALHMADYSTTLLTARVQAGVAWCAHDLYYFDGDQFMTWGMWKYLDQGWKLRPWAQSFGLLIRHAPRGSTPAPVDGAPATAPTPSPYRCAAVVRPDGGWSVFLVNRTEQSIEATVSLPRPPTHTLDVYRFDEASIQQHLDTIALPPSGEMSAQKDLRCTIPARTFLVLAER